MNFRMMLHGEQRLHVHKALPPEGRITINSRCASVVDKGAGKGALLNMERSVTDASSGELYVTTTSTLFCRGDGGFGGPTESTYITHEIPTRPHDKEVAVKTRPDQACIYRLSGDLTGLHIDPELAKLSGFDRPILHGLCTYGFACRAVMLGMCDLDPTKIKTFDARFSSPGLPG